MAGVTFTVDLDPALLADAAAVLDRLGGSNLADISYKVGTLLEDRAKMRINKTKAGPDGTPWLPWSEAYDETRNHAKHSLLIESGDLEESIQNYTVGDVIMIGTNLVYARHQQLGSGLDVGGIPARPFLGVSDQDRRDIQDLVIGQLEDLLQ